MTTRGILLSLAVMLAISVLAAIGAVLFVRSDAGLSAVERLERANPAWKGIGTYTAPER